VLLVVVGAPCTPSLHSSTSNLLENAGERKGAEDCLNSDAHVFFTICFCNVVPRANMAPAGGGGILLWEDKGGGPRFSDSLLACDNSNAAVYGRCVARWSLLYSCVFFESE
jgi:hypothetical protein